MMLLATDAELVAWRHKLLVGGCGTPSKEEVAVLLDEIVRLRREHRRLDRTILAAQQAGLFADEKPKKPRSSPLPPEGSAP